MKRFALLVLWFVGVGAATAVAWAGVSVVENKIIDPPPAIAVDESSTDTDVSSTLPVPEPSTVETSSVDATTSIAPTETTSPTASSTSPSLSPSTTSPSVSTTSTTSTTKTTSTSASQVTSQTFKLIGGTTAISFSPDGATVLWATPEPGFDVRIEPEQPGIKVEFRAEHHRSRVDAWWASGPRHEIDEEPRN